MSSKKARVALVSFLLSAYRIFKGSDQSFDKITLNEKVESIVIFSTTALGDFMFNTPAILSLKSRFPSARITLVSSHKNRNLVESSPWFERVIFWDQKINTALKIVQLLKMDAPDIAVILHSKSPYDVLISTLSGAKYILKDAYNESDLAMRRFVTSLSGVEFNGHLIERKMSLIKSIGCDVGNIEMKIPFSLDAKSKKNAIVIGFQLGASDIQRQWPIFRFNELARLLIASGNAVEIVLIGSPNEVELSKKFREGMTEVERKYINDCVGKVSLTELVETISGFDVLVTGDTGPLHLAVALKVKTVSLFVTANPAYTGPLQDPHLHKVIYINNNDNLKTSDQPMGIIGASEVMTAICEAIDEW
ncbi:TPA: glycosyltransferase family 9 protein [Enterobacter asburiae]|uniref:glycosyltransferase family 9 protein n=1 Tax=Enterobacter asburiae TaxID=61645 RepID=UPI002648962A|nr:glycosyltransferase family 9 protein [Enterobacter asburiae]WKE02512.1 glycosyltransferase family 9 protein [Enterobacter asburiae]WKE07182.1 glycosyltransferase family 9 protein [Enterobacter asburiae]